MKVKGQIFAGDQHITGFITFDLDENWSGSLKAPRGFKLAALKGGIGKLKLEDGRRKSICCR